MDKKQKRGVISLSCIIALIVAVVLTVNIIALCVPGISNALTVFLGSTSVNVDTAANGLDVRYSKPSMTDAERIAARDTLSEEVAAEGIVMLKNDQNYMPYEEDTTFSLFSHSSVDWLTGGTGSGSGAEGDRNLRSVLTEGGFSINEDLWNFYARGAGSGYERGRGSINYGDGQDFSINECPLSVITEDSSLVNTFRGTVAVFVLSRTAGEGCDISRSMAYEGTNIEADRYKHYLEPDSVELEIIRYLNDNFDDVLLLVNSNNAVELGWTAEYENIHNILWVPGTGRNGLAAIPRILKGEVNPSGHLVDTFAYDALSSPAMVNFGDFVYYPEGKAPTGNSVDDLFYYYVAYTEGIYVGYKHYETRYEDAILGRGNAGNYDYAAAVQYPFGYGLSYTTFEWTDFSAIWEGDVCTVNVTVTNTGSVAGKDVVQVYAQQPYTDYDRENGVEKSAVQLVGFAKTSELAAGDSETVTITFTEEELKAYDANGAGTYILDAGTYYVTAATDAHAAVNNIIAKKAPDQADMLVPSPLEERAGNAGFVDDSHVVEVLDTEKYAADTTTGTQIVNQFDHATREDITYLSRQDWLGTWPQLYGEVSSVGSVYGNPTAADGVSYQYCKSLSREDYNKIRSTDSLNPQTSTTETVTTGADNGVELIDLRGLAFDDPLWDDLLDELSAKDYNTLISMAGYGTPSISSIKKPLASDHDGPAGYTESYVFFTELMLSQTWNVELSEEYGEMIGEEALAIGKSGWYAPAMNIHRTPFSGRNNEYYSEDAFYSGYFSTYTIRGVASKGVYTFIKHFAVNEQENHRGDRNGFNGKGEFGLVTWANEQTIRELCLKPFEMAVKTGTVEIDYYKYDAETGEFEAAKAQIPACNAIMTSFNRIGFTWAGGNYNLMTNVLRKEWGFNGFALTDFDNGQYMDPVQMIMAGADGKLSATGTADYDGKMFSFNDLSDLEKVYAREAAHRILYTVTNSAAMNGRIHGLAPEGFAHYKIILICLDVVAAAGVGVLAFCIVKKLRKKQPKAA